MNIKQITDLLSSQTSYVNALDALRDLVDEDNKVKYLGSGINSEVFKINSRTVVKVSDNTSKENCYALPVILHKRNEKFRDYLEPHRHFTRTDSFVFAFQRAGDADVRHDFESMSCAEYDKIREMKDELYDREGVIEPSPQHSDDRTKLDLHSDNLARFDDGVKFFDW